MPEQGNDGAKKGVAAKVLWYFPPIPRFKRWFQSAQSVKDLAWPANEREIDGQLRPPADSPTWKLVDDKWPEFAYEPRNLRLALSADEINPHGSLSSRYSCWPVTLCTYNLPPWLCMKRKFIMLTMLIPGPRQPGNDIDVYLEPLIDDLKILWQEGVEAYDAHKQEYFTLKPVLLWTINDFPAYGNLFGCTTKGYFTCPICNDKTNSHILKHGMKHIYIGHRKYLPRNHPFRNQKKAFNGEQEHGLPPEPLSGEQVLLKVGGIKVSWGKKNGKKSSIANKRKKHITQVNTHVDNICWKKKTIFFKLEYWKCLPIRHNLDVMHIERNVCDSLVGTLLNIPGKTKDGVNSREMFVREVELCGPVFFRWMYPFERYMSILKGYVKNRNRPEGCISQCYIIEEVIEFCSKFFPGLNAIGVPLKRKDEKPLGVSDFIQVEHLTLDQAHLCVLHNTSVIQSYIGEHEDYLRDMHPRKARNKKWLEDEHNRNFIN